MSTIRVASVQTDPRLGETASNLAGLEARLAGTEAELVVFPECALQGYGFESLAEGLAVAEPVPGPSTDRLAALCRRHRRHAIVGLLERASGQLFNTAVLLGPEGVVGVYRKTHLPFLGIDRFTTPGDLGFPVFRTEIACIGILVCYDLSFPEAARALKLDGAQLIAVPTNWPLAAEVSCVNAPPVRAQENHVHLVTADRVGEEAGFRFRGGSRIVDAAGTVLACAGSGEEAIVASLDPAEADRNRVVNVPGRYEIDRIAHRRPEIYERLRRP